MPALPNPDLHSWDLSPAEAIKLQHQLATRLITDCSIQTEDITTIAGVDVSVKNNVSQAAIVVMNLPQLDTLEIAKAAIPTPYPYIPGLLSFREGAVILLAYQRLATEPGLLIFDGQGQIHPRRLGIAAHIGVWLDKPTIGCAKSYLLGSFAEPQLNRGAAEPLYGPNNEQLGVVLRSRQNVKPVFVSPGHLCDIPSACEITMACVTRYRLPEPIRAAHHAAALDL